MELVNFTIKDGVVTEVPVTEEELAQREIDRKDAEERQSRMIEQLRAQAYREEADPLFFKAQRGEATTEEWLAKVEEIRARFPSPESPAEE
jgi:hypothetical protein